MRYLGVARTRKGQVEMPDAFLTVEGTGDYEVVEIGGDILLTPPPLDRERLVRIEALAARSIQDHRESLEGLAR